MSKPKRGKNIKTTPNWRGTCPSCKKTRVKLLWTKTEGDQNLQVCKLCGK